MTGNEFLMQLETLYVNAQEVLTAFAAKQSELVADRTIRARWKNPTPRIFLPKSSDGCCEWECQSRSFGAKFY